MMGNGQMIDEVVPPLLEHRRSMRLALGEFTGWGAAVGNAMTALSEGLKYSGVLPYAGPVPVVTSAVDVEPVPVVTLDEDVEPVPVVTSDMQAPLVASRVAVLDAGLVEDVSSAVTLISKAFP